MANDKMIECGKKLFALKKKKSQIEESLKKVNVEITELATVTLAKLMEDGEVEKFTIAGKSGGTIFLGQELYASVLADDRPKLYDWMRNNGCGDLVKDWVFPQTLTAFCKERLGDGKPVPEMVKTTFIPTAKTRSK